MLDCKCMKWPNLGTPGISLTGGGLVHRALCSSFAVWRDQKFWNILIINTILPDMSPSSLCLSPTKAMSCYLKWEMLSSWLVTAGLTCLLSPVTLSWSPGQYWGLTTVLDTRCRLESQCVLTIRIFSQFFPLLPELILHTSCLARSGQAATSTVQSVREKTTYEVQDCNVLFLHQSVPWLMFRLIIIWARPRECWYSISQTDLLCRKVVYQKLGIKVESSSLEFHERVGVSFILAQTRTRKCVKIRNPNKYVYFFNIWLLPSCIMKASSLDKFYQ